MMAKVRSSGTLSENVAKSKFKIYQDRDRRFDVSEIKIRCPFCLVNALTYRKMIKHVKSFHPSGRTFGLACLSAGCKHYCTKSVQCMSKHWQVNHYGEKVAIKLIPVHAQNISSDKHTYQCQMFNNKLSDMDFCRLWDKSRTKKGMKKKIAAVANRRTNSKKILLNQKISNKLDSLDRKFGRKERKY